MKVRISVYDAGWIYAVREEGTPLIKIGYTTNPIAVRMCGLAREYRVPPSLPYPARVREVRRLKRRRACKVRGPWCFVLRACRIMGGFVSLRTGIAV
jgi:hypothetical protein